MDQYLKQTIVSNHSIDLYNLFCIILNLEAPPNNGSIHNILDMLIISRDPNYLWISTFIGSS